MAIYPLAVPYLLNLAGIAALVIASNDIGTNDINPILFAGVLLGIVLLIGLIDLAVFRNMDRLAKHLDPSRLAITEAVFGVLLAALAVQLMLEGLADLHIINMVAH